MTLRVTIWLRITEAVVARPPSRLGRGFSEGNLEQMRQFYPHWQTSQTVSADSEKRSAKLRLGDAPAFGVSWNGMGRPRHQG
jgi:hypothetical protein